MRGLNSLTIQRQDMPSMPSCAKVSSWPDESWEVPTSATARVTRRQCGVHWVTASTSRTSDLEPLK